MIDKDEVRRIMAWVLGKEWRTYIGHSALIDTRKLEGFLYSLVDERECNWTPEGSETECDLWETSCGQIFLLNEGTPEDNDIKFCFYCGKPLPAPQKVARWFDDCPNCQKEGK